MLQGCTTHNSSNTCVVVHVCVCACTYVRCSLLCLCLHDCWCSEMTLVFKHVNKKVPSLVPPQQGAEPEMKQILFDVSGVIKPGEVVALMVSLVFGIIGESSNT